MADITKELFAFLDTFPFRKWSGIAAGSGSDYVYEIPKGAVKEFERLYMMAGRDSWEDLACDAIPCESVTWKPNGDGSGPEWTMGGFERRYPGYDFDGFYQSGPVVGVKCEKYLEFQSRLWYYDDFLGRYCCTDPQPLLRMNYVVCVMAEG